MTTYTPAYRLTVYVHRSIDSTETTVLTPAAGAAHSDPFKVATIAGVTGFKPYLGLPQGRRGRIDVLSKKTDSGQLTLQILDTKLGVTDNLTRWVTAFLGDASKRNQLGGCKVFVEESLNGGSTWASFFTGRVSSLDLVGRLFYSLAVRDASETLKGDIFVSRPSASATGAGVITLLPLGLSAPYGSIRASDPISGVVRAVDATLGTMRVEVTQKTRSDNVITTNLIAAVGQDYVYSVANVTFGGSHATNFDNHARAHVKRLDTSAEGDCFVGSVEYTLLPGDAGGPHMGAYFITFKSQAVGGVAFPAVGTNVTFNVWLEGRLDKNHPGVITINDVHPVQLWKDILDGYYGYLWSELDTNAGLALPSGASYGSPKRIVKYNAAAFATLLSDASLPKLRFVVDKVVPMNEFIEKYILAPCGLGYYLNGDGEVVPVKLWQPDSLAGIATIGNADVASKDAPAWQYDSTASITSAAGNWYQDKAPTQSAGASPGFYDNLSGSGLFKTIDKNIIQSDPEPIELWGLGRENLIDDKPFKIDAVGIRAMTGEFSFSWSGGAGPSRAQWAQDTMRRLLDFPTRMFGRGPAMITLSCRRTANVTDCFPGTFKIIAVDEVPDPAGNVRGGARVGLCLERAEQGLLIKLTFIDVGRSATAAAPSLTLPGTITGDTANGAQVTVTLNAASEAAVVEYAVTPSGTASHPAATDISWTRAGAQGGWARLYASAVVKVTGLPSGTKIWFRARTFDVTGLLQPSAWVYSTGIQLTAITAPTGCAASGVDGSSALVTWTLGSSSLEVVLYLASPTTDPLTLVQVLPAGTTRFRLDNLAQSTAYKVEVRHRDKRGGESAGSSATFTTSASAATCPAAGTITVLSGSV